MNNLKTLLLTVSLLFTGIVFGQTALQKELYQAFLYNDVSKWETATLNYEKRANLNNNSDLLELIHCYYGYVSVLIDKKQNTKATNAIKKAETYIEKVLKSDPNNALATNYKGIFISYHVSLNKVKAATMGKQILDLLDKAYKLNPNDVQILFDKGNSLYYRPKVFGGDKKEALKYFQKAISIIEKQKNTNENWMYVQMLFLEARCHELLGNEDLAKKGYEKTLKIEPRFKLTKRQSA